MLNWFLEDKRRIFIFYILLRYLISIINNMISRNMNFLSDLKNCGKNYNANINDCSKEGKKYSKCLPKCYFTFGHVSRQFLIIFLSIASLIYNKFFIILLPIFLLESYNMNWYKITDLLLYGNINYTSIFSLIEISFIPLSIYFKILN